MADRSIAKRFGSAIRTVRREQGLTQEALAEASEIHPTYVSMIERGLRNPTLEVAERLAWALQTDLVELLRRVSRQK